MSSMDTGTARLVLVLSVLFLILIAMAVPAYSMMIEITTKTGSPEWSTEPPTWTIIQVGDTLYTCTYLRLPPGAAIRYKRIGGNCPNEVDLQNDTTQYQYYHIGDESIQGGALDMIADLSTDVGDITTSKSFTQDGPSCVGQDHCGVRLLLPTESFASAFGTTTAYTELFACLQLDPEFMYYTGTFWLAGGSDAGARVEVTYGTGPDTYELVPEEWVRISEFGELIDTGFATEAPSCTGLGPTSTERATWGTVKSLYR